MSSRPLLSIVTVVYNDPSGLSTTIDSIREQTFRDHEMVIIDGGSTDATLDVIKRHAYSISHWSSEPDRGIYDAMNRGILAARGEYLQFLNAGDTYVDALSLSRVFASRETGDDIVYADTNVFDRNNRFLLRVRPRDFTAENLRQYGTGVVNHQSFFIRREMAPLYSLDYTLKAELNWYIDIVQSHPDLTYRYLPVPIVNYYQGGRGFVNSGQNLWEWMLLVHRRFGARQNLRNAETYGNFLVYRYPRLKKLAKWLEDKGIITRNRT